MSVLSLTISFKELEFFFFLKNNYNMLLTPQFEPGPPRPPSTLYMGRCQFSYKVFGKRARTDHGLKLLNIRNQHHMYYI